MEVRTDRRWSFEVSPEVLWDRLARVEHYRGWWPWLRAFDGTDFAAGERWACVVAPPLPYSLRFAITLEEVEAGRRAVASVDGDIAGSAALEVAPTATGTDLHLISALTPASPLLRGIASVARPVVRFGHDWVLETGLRQFRRTLI